MDPQQNRLPESPAACTNQPDFSSMTPAVALCNVAISPFRARLVGNRRKGLHFDASSSGGTTAAFTGGDRLGPLAASELDVRFPNGDHHRDFRNRPLPPSACKCRISARIIPYVLSSKGGEKCPKGNQPKSLYTGMTSNPALDGSPEGRSSGGMRDRRGCGPPPSGSRRRGDRVIDAPILTRDDALVHQGGELRAVLGPVNHVVVDGGIVHSVRVHGVGPGKGVAWRQARRPTSAKAASMMTVGGCAPGIQSDTL